MSYQRVSNDVGEVTNPYVYCLQHRRSFTATIPVHAHAHSRVDIPTVGVLWGVVMAILSAQASVNWIVLGDTCRCCRWHTVSQCVCVWLWVHGLNWVTGHTPLWDILHSSMVRDFPFGVFDIFTMTPPLTTCHLGVFMHQLQYHLQSCWENTKH